ncbi:MAG: hypothetical protein HQL56_03475, partial [Magnetococcales bacterium]|nr:hypothetical protein [Magnetococcales bacterium]
MNSGMSDMNDIDRNPAWHPLQASVHLTNQRQESLPLAESAPDAPKGSEKRLTPVPCRGGVFGNGLFPQRHSPDPSSMTADQRLDEVAAILAAGV